MLNEPFVVVVNELTSVSLALLSQFAFNLTESISNLLLSSASITWPTTLKSTPAITLVGTESILISVLPWIVIFNLVLLPKCLELPLASGSVKSSATKTRISYEPGATPVAGHVRLAVPFSSVTELPIETFEEL